MTVSGDFIPDDTEGLPNYPDYPVVLGLTITPLVQGLLFLLLGITAGAVLYSYVLLPAYQEVERLNGEISTKETTLRDQEANLRKVQAAKERLEVAKRKRGELIQLFASQQSLDVVLLDIDRQIKALPPSTVGLSAAEIEELRKRNEALANALSKAPNSALDPNLARINSFSPSAPPALIADNSYGEALNNKLIQQTFAVNMRGDFRQVIEMLRRIEEQRLVMNVSNFSLAQQGDMQLYRVRPGEPIQPVNSPKLNVTFSLQTVVPTDQVFGEATGQPNTPPSPAPSPK